MPQRRFRGLTRDKLNYIVSMRQRVRNWGWTAWVVIALVALFWWDVLGFQGVATIVILAAVIGGVVSYFVTRRVRSKTGFDLKRQREILSGYKKFGADFLLGRSPGQPTGEKEQEGEAGEPPNLGSEANSSEVDSRTGTPVDSGRTEPSKNAPEAASQNDDVSSSESERNSMSWGKFLVFYLPVWALDVAIAASGMEGGLRSVLAVRDPKLIAEAIVGITTLMIAVTFGFGLLIWAIGWMIQEKTPSYLRSVLYIHIIFAVIGALGVLTNPASEQASTAENQVTNRTKRGAPGVENDRTSTEAPPTDHNAQKSQSRSFSLEEFRSAVPTDELGKSGGVIRTWKETAFRSSPKGGKANLIKWVPEDTFLKNARKVGDFYRVTHEGDTGHVHRSNIKPEHRF